MALLARLVPLVLVGVSLILLAAAVSGGGVGPFAGPPQATSPVAGDAGAAGSGAGVAPSGAAAGASILQQALATDAAVQDALSAARRGEGSQQQLQASLDDSLADGALHEAFRAAAADGAFDQPAAGDEIRSATVADRLANNATRAALAATLAAALTDGELAAVGNATTPPAATNRVLTASLQNGTLNETAAATFTGTPPRAQIDSATATALATALHEQPVGAELGAAFAAAGSAQARSETVGNSTTEALLVQELQTGQLGRAVGTHGHPEAATQTAAALTEELQHGQLGETLYTEYTEHGSFAGVAPAVMNTSSQTLTTGVTPTVSDAGQSGSESVAGESAGVNSTVTADGSGSSSGETTGTSDGGGKGTDDGTPPTTGDTTGEPGSGATSTADDQPGATSSESSQATGTPDSSTSPEQPEGGSTPDASTETAAPSEPSAGGTAGGRDSTSTAAAGANTQTGERSSGDQPGGSQSSSPGTDVSASSGESGVVPNSLLDKIATASPLPLRVMLVGGGVVTLLLLHYRYGLYPRRITELGRRLTRAVRRTVQLVRDGLVRAAMGVVRLASTLWAQLLAGGGGLVGVVRAIVSLPATLLAAFAAALNAVLPTRITDTVSSLDAPDETPSRTDADATELPREQLTIRTLWREFTAAINPPNLSAKTPGEVGRYAIDQGVPSRPVRYVVEAFRRVEYAHDDPAQVDTEAVHDAVQSATTAETDTGATEASTEGTDGE